MVNNSFNWISKVGLTGLVWILGSAARIALIFFLSWFGCSLRSAVLSIDQSCLEALLKWEIWVQESVLFSFIIYELVKTTPQESFHLGWRWKGLNYVCFLVCMIPWLQVMGHLNFIWRLLWSASEISLEHHLIIIIQLNFTIFYPRKLSWI